MASSTSASLVAVRMVRMVFATLLLGGGTGMGSSFSCGAGVSMGALEVPACASAESVLELGVDLASGLPLVGKGVGTRVLRDPQVRGNSEFVPKWDTPVQRRHQRRVRWWWHWGCVLPSY